MGFPFSVVWFNSELRSYKASSGITRLTMRALAISPRVRRIRCLHNDSASVSHAAAVSNPREASRIWSPLGADYADTYRFNFTGAVSRVFWTYAIVS